MYSCIHNIYLHCNMLLYFSFVLFSPILSCESEMHDMLLISNNVLHGFHNIMEIQKCDFFCFVVVVIFSLILKCLFGWNVALWVYINHQKHLEQSWKKMWEPWIPNLVQKALSHTYFETFVDHITKLSTVFFSAIVSIAFFCFVLFWCYNSLWPLSRQSSEHS